MDKLLFTPGPLTTSASVKEAMMQDLGSRDGMFLQVIREIRESLLQLAGVSKEMGYETVIMQGSGSFGVESVISSLPKAGKLLVLVNGAYGDRIANMAKIHQLPFETLICDENRTPDLIATEKLLSDGSFTSMVIVHCETTTGIINPIEAFGVLAKKYGVVYLVDSMSAFGAVPLNMAESNIDYLISSSNKRIEGVPGFSYQTLKKGMQELGFTEYLDQDKQGYIINTYHYPENENFDFKIFYQELNQRGYVIYPGKLSKANCFRIGNIGRIFLDQVEELVQAIAEVKLVMGF